MLSRVAASLYWMTRYLERAENLARVVDVHQHALLDHRRIDGRHRSCHWLAILESTGDEALFFEHEQPPDGPHVCEFLVYSRENENSICSCITSAREIARKTRDQLPCEIWEEINRLYLFLVSQEGRDLWQCRPRRFLQVITQSALYLHGIAHATVAREEGWQFMQIGQFLERADKTTRILDIRHHALPEKGVPTPPPDRMEWTALIHSCTAWDAYRQIYSLNIAPRHVVELLLFSERFPRSVRFCASQLDQALRSLSGTPSRHFSSHAEKQAGRLLAELQYGSVEEVIDYGLHAYLDQLQLQLNEIGEAVLIAANTKPGETPESGMQRQPEQQQQTRTS